MGSYSEFYIADFPIITCKYEVYPEIMTIFDEADKKIYERKISERNEKIWGKCDEENEDVVETVYEYRNSIQVVKSRLEVMGFSISNVKKEFEKAKSIEIEELKKSYYIRNFGESDELSILESSRFEDFIKSFIEIRENSVPFRNFNHFIESNKLSLSDLTKYMLSSNDDDFYYKPYGFPCINIRAFLRAVIESCPQEGDVVQDITDLVESGDYEPDFELCNWERKSFIENFEINSKVIILVEGKSDREILNKSLTILYPHLSSYYSFMDFENSNLEGGASFLVSRIKSFIGAGIANRVVAFFDYDTAGTREFNKLLKQVELPHNYKVFQYPKLEIASDYPTIGPTGIANHDINGLACSIELYLGDDVLKQNNDYLPIQWKGFDNQLKKYHGEIIHKEKIHRKFFEKLNICETHRDQINDYDWTGIDLVLNKLFRAFC